MDPTIEAPAQEEEETPTIQPALHPVAAEVQVTIHQEEESHQDEVQER